jgi:hypothetical protein
LGYLRGTPRKGGRLLAPVLLALVVSACVTSTPTAKFVLPQAAPELALNQQAVHQKIATLLTECGQVNRHLDFVTAEIKRRHPDVITILLTGGEALQTVAAHNASPPETSVDADTVFFAYNEHDNLWLMVLAKGKCIKSIFQILPNYAKQLMSGYPIFNPKNTT